MSASTLKKSDTRTEAVGNVTLRYEPRGAAAELFRRKDGELVVSGPANTGKTRACLELLHLCALKYPGSRQMIVRKTRASLTQTAMVTFEKKVLHPLDGVRFHTGDQEYRYPNGASIVVAGLDNASKALSSEYDRIYANQAEELSENDWETLSTRKRFGMMPVQQLLGDCNPTFPNHWLRQRGLAGKCGWLESRHEDNLSLWDPKRGCWTPKGVTDMAALDALSGVRYKRLRLGLWVSAEGMVFDGWDPAVHLIDWFSPPPEWPRYWAIDFGYTLRHPFVWSAWALDGQGRAYCYREIHRHGRLVEDHARQILEVCGWRHDMARERIFPARKNPDPLPQAIICDHDAEGRATLERHLGILTTPAHKAVMPGLEAVMSRLRKAPPADKPALFLMRGALVDVDEGLADAKRPICGEGEMESYVWDTSSGRRRGESPVKDMDDFCDTMRYFVAHVDGIALDPSEQEQTVEHYEPIFLSSV